jgi:hypothetical protein
MIFSPVYSTLLLLLATTAALASTDRFIAGQNICLFRQGSDLSTATSRKAFGECMAAMEYDLKEGCKVGATTATCYDRRP